LVGAEIVGDLVVAHRDPPALGLPEEDLGVQVIVEQTALDPRQIARREWIGRGVLQEIRVEKRLDLRRGHGPAPDLRHDALGRIAGPAARRNDAQGDDEDRGEVEAAGAHADMVAEERVRRQAFD
jgi:hypothetical protein